LKKASRRTLCGPGAPAALQGPHVENHVSHKGL